MARSGSMCPGGSLPRHLQTYWYDVPLIVLISPWNHVYERKCVFQSFPVNYIINILFQHRRMEGPGKIFPGNFLLWRIPPGGFEHGTVQILATSIQGEGQFCFFPTSHWTAVFWRKRWMRPFFLKFSLKVKISFDTRAALIISWCYFSFIFFWRRKKTTHWKDLKLFTMLNTFWRISTPTKNNITQPHTGFWFRSSAARCCGEETFGVKKRQSWRDTKLGTEVAGGRTWWMSWSWEHMGGLESGSKMSFFLERSS